MAGARVQILALGADKFTDYQRNNIARWLTIAELALSTKGKTRTQR